MSEIKYYLPLIFLCFLYGCGQNDSLDMDYKTFNHYTNSGWRKLAQAGEFKEAGKLIDRFLKIKEDLTISNRVNLHFHAGQMYAFAKEDKTALKQFQNAKYDLDPEKIPEHLIERLKSWNTYVDATIAFLRKDKTKLLECRQRMANGTGTGGKSANLIVVDSLAKNFDKSYFEAYLAHKLKSK